MRLLARNKQPIWFANPVGHSWVTDKNGLKTGEMETDYGEQKLAMMSVAISSGVNNLGSQGMADLERYGIVTGYTHRATTEDMACEMGEESIVWYGIPHEQTVLSETVVDGQTVITETQEPTPHNFKVVRKARSLNHLIYYLKEVDVQ